MKLCRGGQRHLGPILEGAKDNRGKAWRCAPILLVLCDAQGKWALHQLCPHSEPACICISDNYTLMRYCPKPAVSGHIFAPKARSQAMSPKRTGMWVQARRSLTLCFFCEGSRLLQERTAFRRASKEMPHFPEVSCTETALCKLSHGNQAQPAPLPPHCSWLALCRALAGHTWCPTSRHSSTGWSKEQSQTQIAD